MEGAVITGDIISSRKLFSKYALHAEAAMELTFIEVAAFLESENCPTGKVARFRGDGFQLEVAFPWLALRAGLVLRTSLLATAGITMRVDARLGIGIGNIPNLTADPNLANGEAYQRSGLVLDDLKDTNLGFALSAEDKSLQTQLNAELNLVEALLQKCTASQAAAIQLSLMGHNQQAIAARLNISQAAVNNRLSGAGYSYLKVYLAYHQNLLKNRYAASHSLF